MPAHMHLRSGDTKTSATGGSPPVGKSQKAKEAKPVVANDQTDDSNTASNAADALANQHATAMGERAAASQHQDLALASELKRQKKEIARLKDRLKDAKEARKVATQAIRQKVKRGQLRAYANRSSAEMLTSLARLMKRKKKDDDESDDEDVTVEDSEQPLNELQKRQAAARKILKKRAVEFKVPNHAQRKTRDGEALRTIGVPGLDDPFCLFLSKIAQTCENVPPFKVSTRHHGQRYRHESVLRRNHRDGG